MARRQNKYIRIGKSRKSRSIFETIELLEEAAQDTVEAYVEVVAGLIARDLNSMILELQEKTTNRGRGRKAGQYNNPLAGSYVKVDTDTPGRATIEVLPQKSVFNLLDAGVPARSSKSPTKPMRFPVYEGRLTSSTKKAEIPVSDDAAVSVVKGSVFVAAKPRFVSVTEVREIPPRYFFKRAADRWRLRTRSNPREIWTRVEDPNADPLEVQFGLNFTSKQEIRFRFDPKLISVRQVSPRRG